MLTLDVKGISFFLKFLLVTAVLFLFTKFSADLAFNSILAADFGLASTEKKIRQNLASASDIAENSQITLAFVGDIMLDRGVKESILKNGGGDFQYPFEKIYETLQQYDILFGNLEGPISDIGKNQGSFYSFRMDPKTAEALAYAGFDVLSVANNHIGDWGEEAINDTVERLERMGIISAGRDYLPKILNIYGVKIAFLAFFNAPEIEIKKSVEIAKFNADIVIASFHFGNEYKKEPNENQKKLARLAIDSGADLVIGSHPHVVQPIEQYKNGYIAYSLGNFVFDQDFSEDTMQGLLLEAESENGQIIKITPKTIIINENFQPTMSEI